MASKLERDVCFLKGYALLVTVTVGILFLCSFRSQPKKEKFEEIDVQRINIVGKDGTLRMAITNKELSPQRLEHGVAYGRSGDRVGLIFYNDEGTENGGLTFGSFRQGGRLEAGGLLAFDQYDQDETVALQYYEHDGRRRSGLGIAEYPSGITNRQREEQYEQAKKLPDGPAKQEPCRSWQSWTERHALISEEMKAGPPSSGLRMQAARFGYACALMQTVLLVLSFLMETARSCRASLKLLPADNGNR